MERAKRQFRHTAAPSPLRPRLQLLQQCQQQLTGQRQLTLKRLPELRSTDVATRWFPNRSMTIVPVALGLATVMHSAQEAAANAGGDSDSVASIVGAVLGARNPTTVNDDWYRAVEAINEHDLVAVASELAKLRH
jgi:hypothetical protein